MADTRQRVDRAIAAMTEAQKFELLDAEIGKVLPGHAPDPENDARYLRAIVTDRLRAQDRKRADGLAELERRLAKLERFIDKGLVPGMAEAIVDGIRQQLDAAG